MGPAPEPEVGGVRRRRSTSTGPRNVRITEVAKAAGVSTATVSRVLNGVASVAPDLVESVNRAITATGYVPNGAGRALRRQRADTWAAVVPDVQNPFFTSVVAEVEEVALAHGYSVVLCNTDERLDRERRYLATVVAHRMSGVLLAPASHQYSDIAALRAAHIPVVLVDRVPVDADADTVVVDNLLAGELAAQHLVAHGYRRLACITGPRDASATEDRLLGFRRALAAAGVDFTDDMVRRSDLRSGSAEVAMRSLLAGANPPDGVFAANGPCTLGAFRGIQAHGLSLSTDVGLVGTDDDVWTRMVSPAVTVIQQPVQQIGRYAGELLASRSAGSADPPHRITLTPTLIVRGSSARL